MMEDYDIPITGTCEDCGAFYESVDQTVPCEECDKR
jgi:Zn finger protein HypA/HybF involved in hydrogenase expression